MERELILEKLNELKRQLPIRDLEEFSDEDQVRRIEKAARQKRVIESEISFLEDKLKDDSNYVSKKRIILEGIITRYRARIETLDSERRSLSSNLDSYDNQIEEIRQNIESTREINDPELLKMLEEDMMRLENEKGDKTADLEIANARIISIEKSILEQENRLNGQEFTDEIANLKNEDMKKLDSLREDLPKYDLTSIIAEGNFAHSLSELVNDIESGEISNEDILFRIRKYKERIPKELFIKDKDRREQEITRLNEFVEKDSNKLRALEEKLSNDDNYKGMANSFLIPIRNERLAELNSYNRQITRLGTRLSEIDKEKAYLSENIASLNKQLEGYRKELSTTKGGKNSKRKLLEEEIKRIETVIAHNNSLLNNLNLEELNVKKATDLPNPLKEYLEKIDKEIEAESKKINKSEQRLDKEEVSRLKSDINASNNRIQFLNYDLEGSFDEIITGLETEINKPKMKPLNTNIRVDFDSEKNEYTINRLDENGEITDSFTFQRPKKEDYGDRDDLELDNNYVNKDKVKSFTSASQELKTKANKVIDLLKEKCTKLKEKATEVKEYISKNRKRIINRVVSGVVIFGGVLLALKCCENEYSKEIETKPIVREAEPPEDLELEMPTFDFEGETPEDIEVPSEDKQEKNRRDTNPSTPSENVEQVETENKEKEDDQISIEEDEVTIEENVEEPDIPNYPEPIPNPTPQPIPEPTPEPTPQPTPEPTPEPTPQPTPNEDGDQIQTALVREGETLVLPDQGYISVGEPGIDPVLQSSDTLIGYTEGPNGEIEAVLRIPGENDGSQNSANNSTENVGSNIPEDKQREFLEALGLLSEEKNEDQIEGPVR